MLESTNDPAERALPWAHRYADWGWSVIPLHSVATGGCTCRRHECASVAKHPRIRWESTMHAAASAAEIEAWWRRWPTANVGVVTGLVSAVAVLDVDPRHGGDASLRELERRFDVVPVTPEVRTGGGGRHLWFRLEEGLPSVPLAPGVDFKADGGIVVAPPSRHASGDRYTWRPGGDPDSLPLAELPPWVRQIARGEERGSLLGLHDEPPIRTTAEQEEFAEAWAGANIDLRGGDRYYLCPFHADHHPSLHIDAEGCRWYCFGCATGGGIGRLLQLLGEHRVPPPRSRLKRTTERGLPVTLHGKTEAEVVGESHHQDELLELTGGRRRYGGAEVETVAELVPEPKNRYDREAVGVRIEGRFVGHVRREDHAWIRPLIDESLDLHGLVTCRAVIRGGWDRGHGDVGQFGVVLLLPTSED